MASNIKSAYKKKADLKSMIDEKDSEEKAIMSKNNKETTYDDDFDFVNHYGDPLAVSGNNFLPDNVAKSAINCGFIGVGGGGGKLVKAFLDLGFNKTILINTTGKDQPDSVDEENFLLIPGADGVGKDVELGKKVLGENSALVEDVLRNRMGKVDWLFVFACGGGGTGSACYALNGAFSRYLSSTEASGKVVYVVTKASAQELLNPTIESNCNLLIEDVSSSPHIVIDNERQLQLLRGKVGMLDMYPSANKNFAKLIAQILKLADENSSIQSFDSKDLEMCLSTSGRMLVGTTVIKDVTARDLGSSLYQGCIKSSPCPAPGANPKTGAMILVATPDMANDPDVSNKIEAALSYVGGRTDTLFSGVYVKDHLPGLIAISILGGM